MSIQCRCFPSGSDGKESDCNARDLCLLPGSGKNPWRRKWQPTPVFLPGELNGQRSLADYSPWGCRESDRTQRLTPPEYASVGAGKPGTKEAFDKISAVILNNIRLLELVVVL